MPKTTARRRVLGMPARLPASLLGILLLVAACGSSSATSAPSAAAPTGAATSAPTAAGDSAEPTEAAGTEEPTAAAQTLDACAMIPVADVKTITGADTTAAVEATAELPDWAAGECWWDNSTMTVRFSLDVGTKDSIAKSDTGSTADEQMTISRAVYAVSGSVKEVAGLGDAAIYAGGFLLVKNGDSIFQLFALNPKEDQMIALAKVVLSHM